MIDVYCIVYHYVLLCYYKCFVYGNCFLFFTRIMSLCILYDVAWSLL